MKPVIHARDHEHGGADPVRLAWEDVGTSGGGGGGGIQFGIANVGNWLDILATGELEPGVGIKLNAAAGEILLSGLAIHIDTLGSGYSFQCEADDFDFHGPSTPSTSTDFVVNVGGSINLSGGGGNQITMNYSAGIQLFTFSQPFTISVGGGAAFTVHGLPTTNPGGTHQLWNDGGTVKIT